MSDGVSEMWYQYEQYEQLCSEYGIEPLSIDNDWLIHLKALEDED